MCHSYKSFFRSLYKTTSSIRKIFNSPRAFLCGALCDKLVFLGTLIEVI